MKKMWLVALMALLPFLIVAPVSANGGADDRVIFGGRIVVDEEDVVDDLVVFGGTAEVRGMVLGDVVVFGGTARISGTVKGDVVIIGGSAELKSTAIIGQDIAIFGGALHRDAGANIGGSVVRGPGEVTSPLPLLAKSIPWFDADALWGFVFGLLRGLFATIALLALGVLVVLFLPGQLEVTQDVLENAFWHSAGVGLLTLLAAAFLTPILVISLIGIPVAFLLWLAIFLASIYALMVMANLVGERAMRSLGTRAGSQLINIVVGLGLVMLVAVPFNAATGGCLGTLFLMVLVMPGLGATILSRFGTLRWRPMVSGGPPSGRMFPPPTEPPLVGGPGA